jgi:hypothetical protein
MSRQVPRSMFSLSERVDPSISSTCTLPSCRLRLTKNGKLILHK